MSTLDDGDVAGIGKGAAGIVDRALVQPGRQAFELVALVIASTRQNADFHRLVGIADAGKTVFQRDVFGTRFHQMRGDRL